MQVDRGGEHSSWEFWMGATLQIEACSFEPMTDLMAHNVDSEEKDDALSTNSENWEVCNPD